MPNLNLRGIDSDLIAELKSEAALAKLNLPEYCTVVFRNRKSSQKNSIAPPRISMGADLAVGRDFGVETVVKDGEVVSETYTGLSGTPVNMEPFRPKPYERGPDFSTGPDGNVVQHSWNRNGESCGYPDCLNSISHPCEGCGRIAGISRSTMEKNDVEVKPVTAQAGKDCKENTQTAQEGNSLESKGAKSDSLGLARKRRLVLDAVATTGGKLTVASEIPALEQKSSNCPECGGFNGNHFKGCKKGK